MKVTGVWCAVAAGLLLAGVVVSWLLSSSYPATSPHATGIEEEAVAESGSPDVGGMSSTRFSVPNPAAVIVSLCGYVFDADTFVPIAGASIEPRIDASAALDGRLAGVPIVTGSDGLFCGAVVRGPEMSLGLEVAASGYERLNIRQLIVGSHDLNLGRILLRRCGSVVVRVVDAGGTPQADVQLRLSIDSPNDGDPNLGLPQEEIAERVAVVEGHTNTAGLVEFHGLTVGGWSAVSVSPAASEATKQFSVLADAATRIELCIGAAEDQLGGVAMGEDGKALKGVFVGVSDRSSFARFTCTDEQGRFRLTRRPGAASPDGFRFQVRDFTGSVGSAHFDSPDLFYWGTTNATLIVPGRKGLQLEVVSSADGEPIRGFRATVTYDGILSGRTRREFSCDDPQGRLFLSDVPPGPCLIRITPSSPAVAPSSERLCLIPASGAASEPFHLEPAVLRRLALQDLDGRPVSGCEVSLRQVEAVSGTGLVPSPIVVEARTDAGGHCVLRGAAAFGLELHVSGPGCLPQVFSGIDLQPGLEALAVQVDAGSSLHGRCVPDGIMGLLLPQLDRWRIGLLPVGQSSVDRMPFSPIRSDGSYRVSGIPSGEWAVHLFGVGMRRELGRIQVQRQSVERDWDASWLVQSEAAGRVLVDGQARPDALVRLFGESGDMIVATDDTGRFVARGAQGRYRIRLVEGGRAGGRRTWWDTTAQFELPALRGQEQVFLFSGRRLRVRLFAADGRLLRTAEITLDVERAMNVFRTHRSDEEGVIVVDPAPTGRFRVLYHPTGDDSVDLGEVDAERAPDILDLVVPR